MLGYIRQQLGDSQYNQIVGQVGENVLIDTIFTQASSSSSTTITKKENPFSFGLRFVFAFGWGTVLYLVLSGWGGIALLACVYGLAVLYKFLANVIGSGNLGQVFQILLVTACVIGAAAVLWFVIPWIFQSIISWWQWLVGHVH